MTGPSMLWHDSSGTVTSTTTTSLAVRIMPTEPSPSTPDSGDCLDWRCISLRRLPDEVQSYECTDAPPQRCTVARAAVITR